MSCRALQATSGVLEWIEDRGIAETGCRRRARSRWTASVRGVWDGDEHRPGRSTATDDAMAGAADPTQ